MSQIPIVERTFIRLSLKVLDFLMYLDAPHPHPMTLQFCTLAEAMPVMKGRRKQVASCSAAGQINHLRPARQQHLGYDGCNIRARTFLQ